MQKAFQTVNIPKLPVLSTEEAIKQIKLNLNNNENWENIKKFIPKKFEKQTTGLSGIFAASLELSKQGVITIMQKKIFDQILIKKIN